MVDTFLVQYALSTGPTAKSVEKREKNYADQYSNLNLSLPSQTTGQRKKKMLWHSPRAVDALWKTLQGCSKSTDRDSTHHSKFWGLALTSWVSIYEALRCKTTTFPLRRCL